MNGARDEGRHCTRKMAGSGLDVDSVIERLLSVRGQPNNRTVQLAEGEIRALCATARYVSTSVRPDVVRIRNLHGFFHYFVFDVAAN